MLASTLNKSCWHRPGQRKIAGGSKDVNSETLRSVFEKWPCGSNKEAGLESTVRILGYWAQGWSVYAYIDWFLFFFFFNEKLLRHERHSWVNIKTAGSVGPHEASHRPSLPIFKTLNPGRDVHVDGKRTTSSGLTWATYWPFVSAPPLTKNKRKPPDYFVFKLKKKKRSGFILFSVFMIYFLINVCYVYILAEYTE